MPILCVNGAADAAALCPSLPPGLAECVTLDAGHNLDRDYLYAAELILRRISVARMVAP
jgi:type IV secretory pathway VirJ component